MRPGSGSAVAPARLACFGKIRGHAEFLRCGSDALTDWLDRWIGPALLAAVDEPNWRTGYDRAPALHFAVLDARSPTAVCGHLQPGADAAGRRFPLVVAVGVDCADPRARLAHAPLVFARAWRLCSEAVRRVAGLGGPAAAAATLDDALAGLRLREAGDYAAIAEDHAATETIGSLQRRLPGAAELARTLLGLGEVAAALAGRSHPPPSGVALPLPADPLHQALTAGWWTALLAAPVAASGRELLLMRPLPATGGGPLRVAFDGASPQALAASWDPARAECRFVDPATAPLAPGRGEAGSRGLASRIGDGSVSLALAAELWHDAAGGRR